MRKQGLGEYDLLVGAETAFEPGSHGRVLRNHRGIRLKGEMDQAEYEALLHAQKTYVERIDSDTRFTAALLCEMHRSWLGSIFEWAGNYRTVELSKGGFAWPAAFLVSHNMGRFEETLLCKHTPCQPAAVAEVTRRMAEVHADLLLIHPFRDGNGGLARWLADLMALQAGLVVPDYGFAGKGAKKNRVRYLEAVRLAYERGYDPLTDFFRESVERRLGTTV